MKTKFLATKPLPEINLADFLDNNPKTIDTINTFGLPSIQKTLHKLFQKWKKGFKAFRFGTGPKCNFLIGSHLEKDVVYIHQSITEKNTRQRPNKKRSTETITTEILCQYPEKPDETVPSLKEIEEKLTKDKIFEEENHPTNTITPQLRKFYLETFKICYFGPIKRWGLVSNRSLEKGEIIEIYSGEVKQQSLGSYTISDYAFTMPYTYQKKDDKILPEYSAGIYGFKQQIDAQEYGGISRFFNCPVPPEKANICTHLILINGKLKVVFVTKESISPGKELLVDFGPGFFKDHVQTHING